MKIIDLRGNDSGELEEFLSIKRNDENDVSDVVKNIINDVKNNGNQAVMKYTEMFDNIPFESEGFMKVSQDEIKKAYQQVDSGLVDVIKHSAENIKDFHDKQIMQSYIYNKEPGIKLGMLRKPLKTVGVYVPAGSAPLISSVLMNIIPAKTAGVKNIIMCSPPADANDNSGINPNKDKSAYNKNINPAILVAADIAGATQIYKIGGAQAIAALAYGTETIPKVDKITGPGNIYVATAKKLIYGQCGIDMIAGPSEVLIIADKTAKAEFIAADLLSQAEHDKLSSSILITTEEDLVEMVRDELARQIALLPRKVIVQSSLDNYGAMILVDDIKQAIKVSDIVAPEHLELCIENAMDYLDKIENAGAIFIGNYSPEPLGDYYAGPNHILPTSGTARFYSPLNVWDFIKQTSVISYEKEALLKSADDIIKFAQAEQLHGHAKSIEIRVEKQ